MPCPVVVSQAATQAVVATQRLVSPEKRLSRVLGQVTPPEKTSPLEDSERRPGRC